MATPADEQLSPSRPAPPEAKPAPPKDDRLPILDVDEEKRQHAPTMAWGTGSRQSQGQSPQGAAVSGSASDGTGLAQGMPAGAAGEDGNDTDLQVLDADEEEVKCQTEENAPDSREETGDVVPVMERSSTTEVKAIGGLLTSAQLVFNSESSSGPKVSAREGSLKALKDPDRSPSLVSTSKVGSHGKLYKRTNSDGGIDPHRQAVQGYFSLSSQQSSTVGKEQSFVAALPGDMRRNSARSMSDPMVEVCMHRHSKEFEDEMGDFIDGSKGKDQKNSGAGITAASLAGTDGWRRPTSKLRTGEIEKLRSQWGISGLRRRFLRVSSRLCSNLVDGIQMPSEEEASESMRGKILNASVQFQRELVEEEELESDTLSDTEEYPWQRYFLHQKTEKQSCWKTFAGAPNSEPDLLKKAGIEATRGKDLRAFLRKMKVKEPERGNKLSSDGSEPGTILPRGSVMSAPGPEPKQGNLSSVLSDHRLKWSFYDLFEPSDKARGEPLDRGIINYYSLLSQGFQDALRIIAGFSIWYSTLVYTFADPLSADQAIGPSTPAYQFLENLDVALDIIYFIGTLLRLRTTVVETITFTVTTRASNISRLVRADPRFWADLVTVGLTPARLALGLQTQISLLFGCLKLLRAWRLWVPLVDPLGFPIRNIRYVANLVAVLLLFGHVWGCCWFLVVNTFDDVQKHAQVIESAPRQVAAYDETPWPFLLYYAYAWRIGVYIVLNADWIGVSSAENNLCAVSSLLGVFCSATVFFIVIVRMQRGSAIETMYSQHVIEVKQALVTLDLPRYLQLRILAFYAYQQLHRSEHHAASLQRALSPQLRCELNLVLYYGIVQNSKPFRNLQPRLVREIIMVLKDRLFLPGDYVYRARDAAHEMFFVSKGLCSVINSDLRTQVTQLQAGAAFGEMALLINKPRNAYVRADEYCVLAVFSKEDFDKVVRHSPKVAEVLVSQMSTLERSQLRKRESFAAAARRRSSLRRVTGTIGALGAMGNGLPGSMESFPSVSSPGLTGPQFPHLRKVSVNSFATDNMSAGMSAAGSFKPAMSMASGRSASPRPTDVNTLRASIVGVGASPRPSFGAIVIAPNSGGLRNSFRASISAPTGSKQLEKEQTASATGPGASPRTSNSFRRSTNDPALLSLSPRYSRKSLNIPGADPEQGQSSASKSGSTQTSPRGSGPVSSGPAIEIVEPAEETSPRATRQSKHAGEVKEKIDIQAAATEALAIAKRKSDGEDEASAKKSAKEAPKIDDRPISVTPLPGDAPPPDVVIISSPKEAEKKAEERRQSQDSPSSPRSPKGVGASEKAPAEGSPNVSSVEEGAPELEKETAARASESSCPKEVAAYNSEDSPQKEVAHASEDSPQKEAAAHASEESPQKEAAAHASEESPQKEAAAHASEDSSQAGSLIDTSHVQGSTLMVCAMREEVEKSTKELQSIMQEITVVSSGLQSTANTIGGLYAELQSSMPGEPEEQDSYPLEPVVAENLGGFGSYEVMQTLHVVLEHVKLLRAAAVAVAEDFGDGNVADDVLFQAMDAAEDAGETWA